MNELLAPAAVTAVATALVLGSAAGSVHAQADKSQEASNRAGMPKVEVGIERCVPTVLKQHPGEVLHVVLKTERGEPVWEIEVAGKDGRFYDVECSGRTGNITETETRVTSAEAPGFKEKVKIPEAKARELALAKHPGTVERVEYEIEADGTAVYELDIKPVSGPDWRVEVDAATGAVKEAHREWLEIGRL